jgi:2-oxoglutarate ferredoxin oxidoreductase subunit gamma
MGKGSNRTRNVAIAGHGGQGVLTIGLLIARAGLKEFNRVSYFPSYETWQRGGRVFCGVVLSDRQVISPIISEPEVLVVFDEPALDLYEGGVKPDGLLIFNSSMVCRELKRKDLIAVPVPATELAQKMGAVQVSNLILLGAYLKMTGLLTIEAVEKTLEDTLREEQKDKLIPLNKEALKCGYERM